MDVCMEKKKEEKEENLENTHLQTASSWRSNSIELKIYKHFCSKSKNLVIAEKTKQNKARPTQISQPLPKNMNQTKEKKKKTHTIK